MTRAENLNKVMADRKVYAEGSLKRGSRPDPSDAEITWASWLFAETELLDLKERLATDG
jgi:hypothetical protein